MYDNKFLIAEYDGTGNLLRNYFNGAGGDFNPSILYEAGKTYFAIGDHLNTTTAITDINGQKVWSASYTSYGEVTLIVENITNNFRFPGQYFDSESGLYYNVHRYFKNDTGRYLTEDPEKSYKVNLYVYADNDPSNNIDPLGLKVLICKRPLALPWWLDAIGYATFGWDYAIFKAHARHCDIKITSPGYQNWGFFGTDNIGNPPPPPVGGTCKEAIGVGNAESCWDKCVNDAAAAGGNTKYNFFTHNCCHWAKETISKCGLKFPYPNVNWPFNPGS